MRYLRAKKRATVSVISFIAITGVALGVGALLSVVSITSGFQHEFRDKVLGVNAHVLVLKYGLNFDEYRDVIARARSLPEVSGAAPFIIHEMMLAKGDRLGGILIKGVDPELMPTVLDLPSQLVRGSLAGLRTPGARPATRPEDLSRDLKHNEQEDLDGYLRRLAAQPADGGVASADAGAAKAAAAPATAALDAPDVTAVNAPAPDAPDTTTQKPPAPDAPDTPAQTAPLPEVVVPTPEAMEAAIAALDLDALPDDEVEERIVRGSAPEPAPRAPGQSLPGVVVGATLAENLGIELGDEVRIISPLSGLDTALWRPNGGAPRSREFRVIGVFEAGFQEYDSRLVYVDLYQAQMFQDQGDTVIGVELRLHDIERAKDVALRLERDLGGGPFHTMDWEELNHNLFTALEVQKVMLTLVIGIIIFVASFVVIATLIMIVIEKRREIGILKAMGARDGGILRIFMVQGAAIGVAGTLFGLLLGGGVCAYLSSFPFPLDPKVYLIDHLPVRTSAPEFVLTVAIALGICTTATLIPSWWAARLLPADGVRPQ
jgi:lipoprotein-releasing system permease protein